MIMIALYSALIIISGALAVVAKNADGGWNAVATILAAVVGGLIAVIGQALLRHEEEKTRERDLLEALRIEIALSVRISSEGHDEKRRFYATSAWEEFRPYLISLKPDIGQLFAQGYAAAYMHRQTVQVELIQSGHGMTLTELSNTINVAFSALLATAEWKKK